MDGGWRAFLEWLEGFRGLIYVSVALVPLLSGFLLIFAFMPAWLALDTLKLVLLSLSLTLVLAFQIGLMLAFPLMSRMQPPYSRPPSSPRVAMLAMTYAATAGIFVVAMTIGSIVVLSAILKWFIPSIHGRIAISICGVLWLAVMGLRLRMAISSRGRKLALDNDVKEGDLTFKVAMNYWLIDLARSLVAIAEKNDAERQK